jgi:uncharacterized protein (DUF2235 family)
VYYRSGVGTRRWEKLRGGAFGMGLSSNVKDAYRFLADAYEPGDELYLFGFSRGAFTARSLAGLVRNSGILRRWDADRAQEAWSLYRDRDKPTGTASTLFRRAYAHETGIHFIGVWDTVGSLGIPVPGPQWLTPVANVVNRRWAFHDTELSSWVKGAFHALAIDEQRPQFTPTLWHQQPGAAEHGQELRQVWFTGVHCDSGGGNKKVALSDIALLWMVHQAHRYGLEFEPEALTELAPDAMGTWEDSRTGFYRLARPWHRPIGEAADEAGRPDGCEYLSETARERHENDASYAPPELSRALTRGRVPLETVPLTATEALRRSTGTGRRPRRAA